MHNLDSRWQRHGNTYARTFARAGRYGYDLGFPLPHRRSPAEAPYAVNVSKSPDKGREGAQHDVVVRMKGGRLVAHPPVVNAAEGDTVMWYTLDPETPGFCVSGNSEADSFSSAALTDESLFTHVLTGPGDIEWASANGQRVSGTVRVRTPEVGSAREMESYRERLTQGVVVLIDGDRVEPEVAEALVGQMVIFAVERADGITVTARSLLGPPRGKEARPAEAVIRPDRPPPAASPTGEDA